MTRDVARGTVVSDSTEECQCNPYKTYMRSPNSRTPHQQAHITLHVTFHVSDPMYNSLSSAIRPSPPPSALPPSLALALLLLASPPPALPARQRMSAPGSGSSLGGGRVRPQQVRAHRRVRGGVGRLRSRVEPRVPAQPLLVRTARRGGRSAAKQPADHQGQLRCVAAGERRERRRVPQPVEQHGGCDVDQSCGHTSQGAVSLSTGKAVVRAQRLGREACL